MPRRPGWAVLSSRRVLAVGFPATVLGTNSDVLADRVGAECLVVDPGMGVVPMLEQVLADHRLRTAAVLLTYLAHLG